MAREACKEFLRWALPRLGLAWPGFRRVHRQVCRRTASRLAELRLPDFAAYRRHLEETPAEWEVLEGFCRIPISRFWRDAAMFEGLRDEVLPALADAAECAGRSALAAWSAGCASGEEPYSLRLLWSFHLAARFPGLSLRILATDADPALLARAARACYRASSLAELPPEWRERAFAREGALLCLKPPDRSEVEFRRQDLRAEAPAGPFDLVLCRNLAFTYFDDGGQRRALARLADALQPGGALVIGRKERLPEGAPFEPWPDAPCAYRLGVASSAIRPPKAAANSRPSSSARST